MKLLFLPVLALLAGCHATGRYNPVISTTEYSRVVATDLRGRPIAEYIAEGPVRDTAEGYRFRAVERRIYRPEQLTFRYPLGRPLTAGAPNLGVFPCHKPEWLAGLDEQ